MIFKRITPPADLEKIIDCYWIVENDDPAPHRQKIIPDGFCEIIFHYRDPYRICLTDTWEQQYMHLLAGQISRHFYLENTHDFPPKIDYKLNGNKLTATSSAGDKAMSFLFERL